MEQNFHGARVFDGTRLRDGLSVVTRGDQISALTTDPVKATRIDLSGFILAPGYVDLQVNGGGGHMVGATTDQAALSDLCALHRSMGTAGILPTLITDTPDTTARVLAAGKAAARAGVPGFLGLHLEGPHLDPLRKGAHDSALIRPMTGNDLAQLCDSAQVMPALMVTVAPEAATPDQIAALTAAGVIVSLGHSDCSYETADAAIRAGARCVTHLFNAMSQLSPRAPGLVGAALTGKISAGIIADGHHVHPSVLRVAAAAMPDGLFLVTDCMSVAGTGLTETTLGGRRIFRRDGRLTLADGTLAGADLTMTGAISILARSVGLPVERALSMATVIPAGVVGASDRFGRIEAGRRADFVCLDSDLRLRGVCMNGVWTSAQ